VKRRLGGAGSGHFEFSNVQGLILYKVIGNWENPIIFAYLDDRFVFCVWQLRIFRCARQQSVMQSAMPSVMQQVSCAGKKKGDSATSIMYSCCCCHSGVYDVCWSVGVGECMGPVLVWVGFSQEAFQGGLMKGITILYRIMDVKRYQADLVIKCGGRGKDFPHWLKQDGDLGSCADTTSITTVRSVSSTDRNGGFPAPGEIPERQN
jgi:hypothetical protein